MEYLINVIHFFIHKAVFRIDKVFKKMMISIIINIVEIPIIKKRFKRQSVEVKKEMYRILDVDQYCCTGRSGGIVGMLILLILWGIVNYYYGLLRSEPDLSIFHFILFAAISLIISQRFLFRNDIYKKYFRKIEKFEKKKKEKWAWYSLMIIIGIIIFSIGGLIFLNFRI